MMSTRLQTKILVVGGHSRSVGKTSLVVDLIRAFPEAAWTAIKITQYGHGLCTREGEGCRCKPDEHTVALDRETNREGHTDTSRFLLAGASRSLWLRAKQGRLAEALPLLWPELRSCENAILESNTILQFLRPALYLAVLDPRQPDFKRSARWAMDLASGFVWRNPIEAGNWDGLLRKQLGRKPCFPQAPGEPLSAGLRDFVKRRFFER